MGNKVQRSKVSNFEWGLVIGLLFFIDIIQKILDFLVIGEVINRFADILIGGGFLFYLIIRGEFNNPETRNRMTVAFLATFVAEEIPVVDIAVFWSIDGWYCWRQSVATNNLADQQQKQEKEMSKQQQIQEQQEKMVRLQAIREAQSIQNQ